MIWIFHRQCIETDESAKKPDHIKLPLSSEEEREAIAQLEEAIATDRVTPGIQTFQHDQIIIPELELSYFPV